MTDPASPRAGRLPAFLTVSLARELGVLLALSLLFPFLIHVLPIPGDARVGPRLLPMYYAPLLAVLLGRTSTALLVAVLAPWLNWALTGHPPPPVGAVMTVELTGFAVVLRLLLARHGLQWWFAVPAFVAGKLVATALVALAPGLIGGRAALAWAVQSSATGLPGVAILVGLTLLVAKLYPGAGGGGGPATA
jgi:hypothetical protein